MKDRLMASSRDQVPEGFSPHFRKSPLTEPWEPLFSKVGEASVVIAIRARTAHCNSRGFLHGGLVSSLADNAMGLSVVESLKAQGTDRARSGSTVNLVVDFLTSAQVGQWIEFVPRVLKVGKSLGFVDCVVLADAVPIARANATFRLYQSAPAA
jgi:uncharacterized protein (TIGR00369 family)